jgi:hypothetical protein
MLVLSSENLANLDAGDIMKNLTFLLTLLIAQALFLTACGNSLFEQGSIQTEVTSQALGHAKVDLNLHPMNKTVCDPFNDNTTQVMEQGVQGTLFYKTPGSPLLSSALDYVTKATKSDKTLFFADINVPTRLFSEGFSTQTTGVLMDGSQNKLVENFGIKFETMLQLAEGDEEGDYELALLADDGARLKYKDPVDDTWKEVINNDGDHPTRMGCASNILSFNRRSQIPIEVVYYQGPRYHIANVLMWRKATVAGKDTSCGQTGNSLFFDPNHGSTPMKAYEDLLARAWKPISAQNFWLNGTYNPCTQGTKPVITNFAVTEIGIKDVFLAWQTDVPSSSQVRLINNDTGEEILTTADNLLRTDHAVHVTGLRSETTYRAQAVSISQDLGNTLSQEIVFTTH